MLYVTTRERNDAFTAHKTLFEDTATDGGLYIPYMLPAFTKEELDELMQLSYGEIVANVLNLFFSAKLTVWDVDFITGKNPIKTAVIGRKIVVAEIWRNPGSDYAYFVNRIYARLTESQGSVPSNWAKIAIKIAVIFATYAELIGDDSLGFDKLDFAVQLGDMTDPAAVYYARKMGLPIGNIVMCCDDDSGVWDLLNRGEVGTALLDAERRLGLERLVGELCGREEAVKYNVAAEKRGLYILNEEFMAAFSDGLYAAVIGKERIGSVINSVYRNNSYVMDPQTAVCFGGLQDHRAKVGESKLTVMFAERTPMAFAAEIQKATGLTQEFVSALNKKG